MHALQEMIMPVRVCAEIETGRNSRMRTRRRWRVIVKSTIPKLRLLKICNLGEPDLEPIVLCIFFNVIL